MSLRRAVGSLLARRFSPRVIPRTAAARSLYSSLRNLPIDDVIDGALIFAAAKLGSAGGTLALRHYTKVPAGEMIGDREEFITRDIRKPDMKERFEQFIMKNDKTYRDEEEKAMRFELFKATVEWIESQPPDVQKRMFPEITYFADFTEQEQQSLLAFPDEETRIRRKNEMKKLMQAKYEKGESVVYMRDDKDGDKEGHKQRDKQVDKQRGKQRDKQATQAAA